MRDEIKHFYTTNNQHGYSLYIFTYSTFISNKIAKSMNKWNKLCGKKMILKSKIVGSKRILCTKYVYANT